MRRGIRGRVRARGAAVIEFALTLPLLVPLMLFMIEYGHYYWVTLNAVEAAKMGLASAVKQQTSTTHAANCADTAKVNVVTQKGHDDAVAYFTNNCPALASAATPTVTCVNGTVNGVTINDPSWQIVVKMDFRPLIGFRLRWLRASTSLSGGITYSTPALIRTF